MAIQKLLKIGALFIFAVVLLLFVTERISTSRTDERAQQLVAELAAALKPGLPVQAVETELDRLQFAHSRDAAARTVQGRRTQIGRYRLVYETEILVKIQLDSDGRVVKHEATIFHWGL